MFGHDGSMVFGGFFMWLFWLILLVLIVAIIRALVGVGHRTRPPSDPSPLDILKRRYARGEIEEDEFQRKRQELER